MKGFRLILSGIQNVFIGNATTLKVTEYHISMSAILYFGNLFDRVNPKPITGFFNSSLKHVRTPYSFKSVFQEVGQLGGERGGELSMCSCSRGGKQLQAYGKGEGKP